MPRPPRAFLPDYPQHLIQRGNNRTAIFLADADYAFYYNCLLIANQEYICPIHAYVLMTNHVHLLTTPAYPDSLARLMQCIGRRYVRYFNGRVYLAIENSERNAKRRIGPYAQQHLSTARFT